MDPYNIGSKVVPLKVFPFIYTNYGPYVPLEDLEKGHQAQGCSFRVPG